MSSLNLVPNPTVIVVQTAIFIGNFVAIKKLFLDPYLKVSNKRESLTEGSDENTKAINERNAQLVQQMQQAHESVNNEGAQYRRGKLEGAKKRSEEIVGNAEQYAKTTIDQMHSGVTKALAEERAKIPSCIDDLTEEIYRKIVTI